jgi:hypothetical protein
MKIARLTDGQVLSKLAHTPGEWRVLQSSDARSWHGDFHGAPAILVESGEYLPATVANARLIAASPELLATLKAIGTTLSYRGTPTERQLNEMFTLANEAIAKAEGRS